MKRTKTKWRNAANGLGYTQEHTSRCGAARCRTCKGEGLDEDGQTCPACGGSGFEGER